MIINCGYSSWITEMKSLTGLQRAIIPDQTSWIIYQPNCWSRYWQRKKRMSHIIKQGIYQTTVTHAKPLKIFLSFWVAFHIQPLLIIKGSVKRRESESIIFWIYFQNRLTNDDLWTSTRQASFFFCNHMKWLNEIKRTSNVQCSSSWFRQIF